MAYRKRKSTTCRRKRRIGIKRKKTYSRKGKISNWVKAGIAIAAPSALATGYRVLSSLLKPKTPGFSDIYV